LTTLPIALFLVAAGTGPAACMLDKLEAASLLEAGFEQTDFWALTRETEVFTGTLVLSRDGRFLLDYSDPGGRRMGFDGEALYTVDPLYRQVLIDSSSQPASFTALLESIRDPEVPAVSSCSGDTVFVVMDGPTGQGISRMEFCFLSSDSLPRGLSTFDQNGNWSRWRLTGVSVSDDTPGSVFELVTPAGYEVLRAGDL